MHETIDSKIEHNTGLIFKQLHKFHLTNDPEAESIGYEALYNAILTYSSDKGVKFSTYATVCIYNALGSYVRTLNRQRQLEVISYNNIAFADDGTEHEFVDFLEAPETVETLYDKTEATSMVRCAIKQVYDGLTNDKQKKIVKMWCENNYDIAYVMIAKRIGVSQPYVSQVINSLKSKIKKKMEAYYNG